MQAKRGFDLISDVLPFGRLWYDGPSAVANAARYLNVIETHEHGGYPLNHVVPHMYWRIIRYSDGRDMGFKNARESCSMAVVLVQNGVRSWPKSHLMHDEVDNDISSGPLFPHDDPVFAKEI